MPKELKFIKINRDLVSKPCPENCKISNDTEIQNG
jgi:hypothetical protein